MFSRLILTLILCLNLVCPAFATADGKDVTHTKAKQSVGKAISLTYEGGPISQRTTAGIAEQLAASLSLKGDIASVRLHTVSIYRGRAVNIQSSDLIALQRSRSGHTSIPAENFASIRAFEKLRVQDFSTSKLELSFFCETGNVETESKNSRGDLGGSESAHSSFSSDKSVGTHGTSQQTQDHYLAKIAQEAFEALGQSNGVFIIATWDDMAKGDSSRGLVGFGSWNAPKR